MEFIADVLLVAGAIGAGFYCYVLSRRLTKFNDLEKGVGGAVAVLSSQVDSLNKSLNEARAAADGSGEVLADLTMRAEAVAGRLELMMASMHDLPQDTPQSEPPAPEQSPQEEAPDGPMFVRHPRGGGKAA